MLLIKTRYQCVAERLGYLLRCSLVSLSFNYHTKNWVIHSFLRLSSDPVCGLEGEKHIIPNFFRSIKLELGEEINQFKNKDFPQSTAYPLLLKRMAIVSPRMRHVASKIFVESCFRWVFTA